MRPATPPGDSMALYTDERRIGVLGMQQAGKSTFLTALINHLQAHDPGEFPLGSSGTRLQYHYLPPADDRTPEFPYDKFRDQLQDRRWPAKTTGLSEYRCRLDFTGGGRGLVGRVLRTLGGTRLTLTDIPGEWLSDLTMAGADYAAWADALFDLLEGKYLDASRDYLRLVEGGGPLEAGAVVTAFKRTLARLVFEYMPIVTPSSLLVSPGGEYLPKAIRRSRDAEWVAANRFAGLDADREFAPLPAAVREAHPAIADAFARHYAAYRDRLVTPLADTFFACDQLVILVDPTVLLAAGVGAYNGCVHMLTTALAHLARGQSTPQAWGDWALRQVPLLGEPMRSFWKVRDVPKVRKVAVVASQADKVHRDDRDKLGDLVREMVEPLLRRVVATKWLTVEYFVCSAVDSSASRTYPQLEVQPFDEDGRASAGTRAVSPSPVPARWPKAWQAGEYTYPRFAPIPPARFGHPPSHIGLNRVAEFLFDL